MLCFLRLGFFWEVSSRKCCRILRLAQQWTHAQASVHRALPNLTSFLREGGLEMLRILAQRLVRQWIHFLRQSLFFGEFSHFLREGRSRILRSISSFSLEEVAALVVDNGRGMSFAGFACADTARALFSSIRAGWWHGEACTGDAPVASLHLEIRALFHEAFI